MGARASSPLRTPSRALPYTALTFLACVAFGHAAQAHSGFPLGQHVAVHPNDDRFVVLRTSYGVLITRDGGETWGWVCETAVGNHDAEPTLTVTSEGIVYVAASSGVTVSVDGGCTWMEIPALRNRWIVDLAPDPADPRHVLMLEQTALPGEAPTSGVWRTLGPTEADPLGSAFDADLLPLALRVAPSDPEHFYVSALRLTGERQGLLLASADRGSTWTSRVIPDSSATQLPFVAAIDRADPRRAWVRLAGDVATGAVDFQRVLETPDMGESWITRFEVAAEIRGFALAPSNDRIALGLAFEPGTAPEGSAPLGIYVGAAPDWTFSLVASGGTHCLGWPDTRLFACQSSEEVGFDLGVSRDGAATFETWLRREDVRPLACGVETPAASQCDADWAYVCPDLGNACAPASTESSDGAETTGGEDASAKAGCNCAADRRRPHAGAWGWLLLAAGWAGGCSIRTARRR